MPLASRWVRSLFVLVLLAAPAGIAADLTADQTAAGVPADLKPLLVQPASEMRLVVTRYNSDRQALNLNYAGPGGFNMRGGGGGRGQGRGAAGGPGPIPVSAPRLSRLKRFDLDWQTALGKLNTSKF